MTEEKRKAYEAPGADVWKTEDLQRYAARPLAGVWATAPYLHNGSVPTLYHLLLPPEERPKKFWVGHRNYDPKRLGYRTETEDCPGGAKVASASVNPEPAKKCWAGTTPRNNIEVPDGLWQFDVTKNGNGNGGHLYGTDMKRSDRMALLEYLKTL